MPTLITILTEKDETVTEDNVEAERKNKNNNREDLRENVLKRGENEVSKSASALVIAASEKAGMEGIDRTKIDAIILRESGNSAFMQQQRKRDEQVNLRIEHMKQKFQQQKMKLGRNFDSMLKALETKELEPEIQHHLKRRPLRSTYVVIDMDMFYMACELLTRPDHFKSKPCCVGRGMITTSNYVARRYGVRSAMAGFVGDRLVEELSGGKERLIHFPNNFSLYKAKSKIVKEVLSEYDPNMKSYSLDEAYLNIERYIELKLEGYNDHAKIVELLAAKIGERRNEQQHSLEDNDEMKIAISLDEKGEKSSLELLSHSPKTVHDIAQEVVQDMRRRVKEKTGGLTCSAGLAPNFLLAKIASDRNKPNGQCFVDGTSNEEMLANFLHPLPTRKVGGIGRVTEKILFETFNISTVGDLYRNRALIRLCFSPAMAKFLLRASIGCSCSRSGNDDDNDNEGNDQNTNDNKRKGISKERTFVSGRSWVEINETLETITRQLSSDMQNKKLFARTITLKVKLQTFDVVTKARSLPKEMYTQNAQKMVQITTELLRDVKQQFEIRKKHTSGATSFSVRLLGVRCSNFQEEEDQQQQQNTIQQYFQNTARKDTPSSSNPKTGETATMFYSQSNLMTTNAAEKKKCANNIDKVGEKPRLQNDYSYNLCNDENDDISCPKVLCDITTSTTASNLPTNRCNENDEETSSIDVEKKVKISCPLCGKHWDSNDNFGFNKHVDECLNGPLIRRTTCEEENYLRRPKKKKLTDYFS